MVIMEKINMRSVLFGILCCMVSAIAYGQNTAVKTSVIRDKAYETINKGYDTYATVKGEDALASFLRLFVDEEAIVYNDLLGISSKRNLPVGDYARLLADSRITTKRVHIKNLQMEGNPIKTDGGWNVTVSFDKEMSYYNNCGVYFSSREFYGADYHLTATLFYDEVDGQCRIARIDGTVVSNNMLPMDYVVVKQTDRRDIQLSYHQQPIIFNSSQQAILPGNFDSRGFSHPKFDASCLSPTIDACNIVTMNYLSPSNSWRIKPNFGIGLGDALTIEGDSMMNSTKSSSLYFGVDFGYQFMETGPLKLSAFIGLGISSSSMKLGYKNDLYSTRAGADADGEEYTRNYRNLNLNQTVRYNDFSIPIYLDVEYGIGSLLSFYADLGIRLNFNMSSKVSETSGSSSTIDGLYDTTTGIRLGEKWGFNGFVSEGNFNKAEPDELKGVKNMTLDAMGSLGLRCGIPNTSFSVNLGICYMKGLGDIMKQEKTDVQPAIVYNTLSEDKLTSTEHVNLHGQIESVKHNSLQLNIGLIYKF